MRRFVALWAVAFAVATTAGGLFALQQSLQSSVSLWRALMVQLPPWYSWAFLTPFVVETVLRLRPTLSLRCAVQVLGAGLAFVAVQLALIVGPLKAAGYFEGLTFAETYGQLLVRRGASEVVTASLIVAVVLAVLHARRAREEELQRLRTDRQVLEARLQALRVQLHPHFLLNTLNTISALAAAGEREATEQAIVETGELLREALRRPDLVTLERELEYLRLYLRIVTLGRSAPEPVEVEVADGALRCPVPSFILQPLVENALTYGARPPSGGPRVWIRARCRDGMAEIEVENVVPPEASDPSGWDERIGLQNTRTRMEALYGDQASLEIHGLDRRVRVLLRLPSHDGDLAGPDDATSFPDGSGAGS